MRIGMIIVAAGEGRRAGDGAPKQFRALGGKRVVDWSLDVSLAHPGIDQTVLVLPADATNAQMTGASENLTVVPGGATRAGSVQNGLSALSLADDDIVLIHDAARPGLNTVVIDALIAALDDHDAAAPMLPLVDAIKARHGEAIATVDRSNLVRIQTPQAFRYGAIGAAHRGASQDLVDDLQAIEESGGRVALVPGSERLSKLTFEEDFERMARLLGVPGALPRIGSGYDVHAFGPGDKVVLCGVAIEHNQSLEGHSDADVAWHALTDALLGAAALGDIGDHFPPSDPQWRGADSALFLQHAARLVREAGYAIANCDLTIICEAPKIKPHRDAMRTKTAEILDLPVETISVKATTTESLGFTGRREGIAAQASVLLSPYTTAA